MSLANYTELKAAIADWLNRTGQTELEDRAGDFVGLFESQFNKQEIRHPKASVRTTLAVSGEYVALPSDFSEMQRLRTTGGSAGWATHRYVTPEELEDDKAANDSSGRP